MPLQPPFYLPGGGAVNRAKRDISRLFCGECASEIIGPEAPRRAPRSCRRNDRRVDGSAAFLSELQWPGHSSRTTSGTSRTPGLTHSRFVHACKARPFSGRCHNDRMSDSTAPALNLSVDEVLTTTRSVRKRLDLDRPVPREVLMEVGPEFERKGPRDPLSSWSGQREELSWSVGRSCPSITCDLVSHDPSEPGAVSLCAGELTRPRTPGCRVRDLKVCAPHDTVTWSRARHDCPMAQQGPTRASWKALEAHSRAVNLRYQESANLPGTAAQALEDAWDLIADCAR
jgi:hypothetical protein